MKFLDYVKKCSRNFKKTKIPQKHILEIVRVLKFRELSRNFSKIPKTFQNRIKPLYRFWMQKYVPSFHLHLFPKRAREIAFSLLKYLEHSKPILETAANFSSESSSSKTGHLHFFIKLLLCPKNILLTLLHLALKRCVP